MFDGYDYLRIFYGDVPSMFLASYNSPQIKQNISVFIPGPQDLVAPVASCTESQGP